MQTKTTKTMNKIPWGTLLLLEEHYTYMYVFEYLYLLAFINHSQVKSLTSTSTQDFIKCNYMY